MNQNQCVPNWDLDDVGPIPPSQPPVKSFTSRSHSTSLSAGHDTSMFDYEMAELTWQNGQLTMHGLGLPRVSSKTNIGGSWEDKQVTRAHGTLESIVNQATHKLASLPGQVGACDHDNNIVPWLDPRGNPYASTPTSVSMAMDALVPSDNNGDMGVSKGMVGCSTRVESCSIATARVPVCSDWSVSASESDRWQSMRGGAEETSEQLRSITNNNGMTSTSFGASLDNTKTVTIDNDQDSACHSRRKRERDEEHENQKKGTAKSNSSTKRSRAAAIHNQSERKRRDKINQRMKTLQKMVPNSNKTDKASMLDEVIDYLKQLQAQVQMLNTMRMPSMMMPLAIQQQLQMSMMAPTMAGMGMGMGMGFGMNLDPNYMNMNINGNAMARPNVAALSPAAVLNPAAYMALAGCDGSSLGADRLQPQATMVPTDPLAAYLACQSHPSTMDTYTRMAAMYQQLQQQQQSQQHQQPGPATNS